MKTRHFKAVVQFAPLAALDQEIKNKLMVIIDYPQSSFIACERDSFGNIGIPEGEDLFTVKSDSTLEAGSVKQAHASLDFSRYGNGYDRLVCMMGRHAQERFDLFRRQSREMKRTTLNPVILKPSAAEEMPLRR